MSERELEDALAKAQQYVLDDLSAMTAPWPDLQLISRAYLSSRPLILEEAAKRFDGTDEWFGDQIAEELRSLSHDGKADKEKGDE
jgi:hypothetical protein